MMNNTAAICMTRMRPSRSASVPAIQAPSAAPSRVSETVSPVPEAPMSYLSRIAPTAPPLMTAVSYPNRKPPSAARRRRALHVRRRRE